MWVWRSLGADQPISTCKAENQQGVVYDCAVRHLSLGQAQVAHLDVRSLFPDELVTLELIKLLGMLKLVLTVCRQLWLAVPVHKARPVEGLQTTGSCLRLCQKSALQEAQPLKWPCSDSK